MAPNSTYRSQYLHNLLLKKVPWGKFSEIYSVEEENTID